jgi:hypothetical protein
MRVLPLLALSLLCGAATAVAACGSTEDDSAPAPAADSGAVTPPVDTDGAADAGPAVSYPAPHSTLPTVATSNGPVLANPTIVPIFFPGFGFRTQLIDFTSKIGKSAYWKAVSSEYGVGMLTAQTAIDVVEPPDAVITDADIQAWLKSRFDGTHPEFGTAPIAGAIYTVFYPPTTTIYLGAAPTTNDGGVEAGGGGTDAGTRQPRSQSSCTYFGGYHQNIKVGTADLAYAVIPQCAAFGPLMGLDVVTGTPSHEWVEAATDPYPLTRPAYSQVDDDHISWTFALGAGEVADMCAQYDSSFYKDPEIGYFVQRSWSNAAAKIGTEPCVPALPGAIPYFNASPVLKDNVSLTIGETKGVTIPVGKSKVVELDLFSSGPTSGPWTVAVQGTGNTMAPPLSFALDKTSGVNGDKIMVTITSNTAASTRLGGTTFIVTSTLGTEKHYWAGIVGN